MTLIETSVFAGTLRKAHDWLEDVRRELGDASEQDAYRALRATLQVLREGLTLRETADLSAQLPMVLRGLFLEGWRPTARPGRLRREAEFLEAVQQRYGPRLVDTRHIVTSVLRVLERRVSKGEVEDLKSVLPAGIRALWPRSESPEDADREPPVMEQPVGRLMSRDLLTVSAMAPLQDALEAMTDADVRHLVVLAAPQAELRPIPLRAVVGILSNRDALAILQRHPDEALRLDWLLVRDVMTHAPLVSISPEAALREAATIMHREKISAIAVVEGDELVGLLTSDDVLYAGSVPLRVR